MLINSINAFVEGRGSLASMERAIDEASNPLMARGEFERELATECAMKTIFATIPPPSEGLGRVLKALRSAPFPELSNERAESLEYLGASLRSDLKSIPEPAGGYSAALSRLKNILAAAPAPALNRSAEMDIQPSLDMPVAGSNSSRRSRRSTTKIIRMPKRSQMRDVLAAGKDLPENPNDL
jgi:hypothetical protein